jgi:hypothetical protein
MTELTILLLDASQSVNLDLIFIQGLCDDIFYWTIRHDASCLHIKSHDFC